MRQKRLNRKLLKYLVMPVAALVVLFLAFNLLFPVPDRIDYSTIIADKEGNVIHAYLTIDDKWRMKTELSEISPLLQRTIVEKEDRYFYHHFGLNPFAIIRAGFNNVVRMKRTSGASTITMQVARVLEPGRRTYRKKIIECFRALQLEMKYSKDEILQLYLNLVPYGGNIEGVKAAALLYFNKNPDHLSLAEITSLSVIPNRPSSLVPGRNNEAIIEARNKWLRHFAANKIFSPKEIADALEEPMHAKRLSVPRFIPHLARRLKKDNPGKATTTIDLNMQLKIEKLVEDYSRVQRMRGINNAAVIVVENSTRNVIAYLGSDNFKDSLHAGQVDGVTAVRQPGSTLKPLVYGMSIDEGLLTPKRTVTDVAVNYAGYTPENYDREFRGLVTMEYALAHSLNIPAVNTLGELGKESFISTLSSAGFRQIKKDQKKLGLSMILGGCGATLEELTALYSSFANDGYYRPLRFTSDQVIPKRVPILSPSSTFMVTEILSRIDRPDFPINWQSTERMPKIAWKTGTSYGRRDAWSIGYNKQFTVGVWLGNFDGNGIAELTGSNTATPLLFKIFNTIDYDSDSEWFSPPEEMDLRRVCSETGMPPAENCEHLVSDYFIPLTSSVTTCNDRMEIAISPDEKMSYCKSCLPTDGYKKKWYRKLSTEMQHYLGERKITYTKIPSHNPECEKIFRESGPQIKFPHQGTEYLISKKNPEPLMLFCNVGNDVDRVFWYINNEFYKSGDVKSTQFFMPSEGKTKISCTDDKGRNRDIWIEVRYVDL